MSTNPHFFAYTVATLETLLAIFFIFGILINLASVVSMILSLGIWSVAEGFGGPLKAGKTDIGTSIMYAIVAALLLAVAAGRYYGVDRWLTPRLGRFGFLAAGPIRRSTILPPADEPEVRDMTLPPTNEPQER